MWGLFILSPILSLFFALKNFRYASAKNIVWAFTVFYGFTFVISNEGMDANRYRDQFLDFTKVSLTFSQFTETLYDVESKSVDVLNPAIQYLVSRFTDNPRFLFAAYGLIFGFFYSRNIWYILDRVGADLKPVVIPLIVTFAFLVPIWDLNGFRFNTSMHLFLFGILPYLFENKKSLLIVSLLSVFVHFSFLFPVLVFLSYLILGNRLYIFFFFFIGSMFITEINVDVIRDGIANNLPEVFQVRTSGYTSDEKIEARRNASSADDKSAWFVKLYGAALKWLIIAFISAIFLRGKKYLSENKGMMSLYCFALYIYGWANISSILPSGGRFVTIAHLFSMALIILYVQNGPQETILRRLIPLSVPVLLLFFAVQMRIGFDTIGVFTIFGNPLTAMFFDGDIALIKLIK